MGLNRILNLQFGVRRGLVDILQNNFRAVILDQIRHRRDLLEALPAKQPQLPPGPKPVADDLRSLFNGLTSQQLQPEPLRSSQTSNITN